MTEHIRIENFDMNVSALHKSLKNDPAFLSYLETVADALEDEVKGSMDENSTSLKRVSPAAIRKTREYYKNLTKARVKRGRYTAFIVLTSGGNNSADYEAEHSNLMKGLIRLRGRRF